MSRSTEAGSWTLLTNHAHVLMVIAERPTIRVREIASATGITERSVQRIIGELEVAGFVRHHKVGRRNRYIVDSTCRSGHPLESEVDVEQLTPRGDG